MSRTSPRSPWPMVLTGVFVTLVAVALARLAYGVILPFMRQDLGLGYQAAGNLATVTSLGYLAVLMPAGASARRFGARNTILVGVVLITAGFAGLALASNYLLLVALMALLGVGTALTYTPFISLLAAWFPARRGVAIGLAVSGVGMGMFLAGFVVPQLVERYGESGWRLAWGSFALAALAVCGLILAVVRNAPALPAAVTGGVSAARSVYRNPRVVTVGLAYGIIGLTYIVQTIFVVSFMLAHGFDTVTAGRLVALNGLLSVFSGVAWGWLSDRLGRGVALMLSMGLVVSAMLAPVILPTLAVFTLHFVLLGCTLAGLFTLIQAAGTEQVEARDVPLALSYVTLYYAVGQLVGPALAGWLIDRTGSFRLTFALAGLALAVGLYLTYRIHRFPGVPAVPAAAAPADDPA